MEYHETSFYCFYTSHVEIYQNILEYQEVNNYCLVIWIWEISVKMPKYFD